MELLGMTLGIGMLLLYIAILIAQIYTLVIQAKAKEWLWFVLTLIITPVWLIYWIVKWIK